MQVKISIIVPIYNIKEYVSRCIDSIIKQTYKNIEIILVDDGSTDGSSLICDNYSSQDSRIKVIHKSNGGLVSARQAGAEIATGEYITNVDGDDWIDENCIYEYVQAINESNADIIWNLSMYREYSDRSILQKYKLDADKDIKNESVQLKLLDIAKGKYGFEDDIAYYVWNKCIKKEVYVFVTMSIDNRIRMAEDAACVVRCLSMTDKVYFISTPVNHYLQRENSITHDFSYRDAILIKLMRDETLSFIRGKKFYECFMKEMLNKLYIKIMIIKCFEFLQKDDIDYLFPFENVKKGNKVIVYGLGNVGRKILDYIKKYKEYDLLAVSDMHEISYNNVPYVFPRELYKYDYDNIIIASSKRNFIEEIRIKLLSLGIDPQKIANID